ncbi:thiol-disulfide oxidoreductase ResA [Alkalihalobacillus sp. LMS39]|uniref:thiol-disulfide oxidoreductase ResA n=1 Tax=Alkalihalobacillus sp. LMS39 TaxID=2924032 RepID=UPI001FB48EB1|nr:thiol-disulfide oxidoreductase ResA [Alkalihalobacillus sp. LMS39]UOE92415.1 thiol-disulfide oxidoreductase ResA [Alkalihalobacillus sp. LMS39]
MIRKRLLLRTSILVVITIALVYTFYTNFFADKSSVRVGEEPINFVLTTLEGERIELADYKGQGVFLNFWGTYCKPCEEEMPIMDDFYQIYKDQGVEIIAVNVNEADLRVQRFVERYNLSFPVAIDKGMLVSDAYGIRPLPITFLINEHGIVEKIHYGMMDEALVEEFMELIKPKT